MMSFVRTVRHSKRLPSSWFFSINKKKIQGESVILPTFFSTANLSMDTNYDGHGFYSVSADFDEYPAEANCCLIQVIVSKGVPMLPLGDFLSNDHAHENEILLPPGIELVYLGDDVFELDDEDNFVHIECYVARVRSFDKANWEGRVRRYDSYPSRKKRQQQRGLVLSKWIGPSRPLCRPAALRLLSVPSLRQLRCAGRRLQYETQPTYIHYVPSLLKTPCVNGLQMGLLTRTGTSFQPNRPRAS